VFTGLIRYRGTLGARAGSTLRIRCPELRTGLNHGDSVAVNGACLTVAELESDGFRSDLLAETLKETTLGVLPAGARLNLEPALRAGEAFGGHFVQGHVDGTVRLKGRERLAGGDWQLGFELPDWLKPYALSKGSIAVDGVSLTLQELTQDLFQVSVIPTTWRDTNLSEIQPGSPVNIEADMMIRAVRHALELALAGQGGLTLKALHNLGY